ncbi:MAG: hypothetical protein J5680_07890, partial [Neisseriaceae bacterium]|nr:hypothetical protein [Neisseriaceae bacterium]
MTAYLYFLFSSFKLFSWKQRIKFTVPYLIFALFLLHYLTTPNPVPSNWWDELEVGYADYSSVWDYMLDSYRSKIEKLNYLPWNMDKLYIYNLEFILPFIWIAPFLSFKNIIKNHIYIPLICSLL